MQYVRGCEAQSRTLLNRCCWGVVVEILQSQHTHLARGRRRRTLSACTSPSPRTLTRRSEQREPTTTATHCRRCHTLESHASLFTGGGNEKQRRKEKRQPNSREDNEAKGSESDFFTEAAHATRARQAEHDIDASRPIEITCQNFFAIVDPWGGRVDPRSKEEKCGFRAS
jgi:hypothetical protein